jgi:orotidine-5'-phosphate decarboxylase
LPNTFGSKLEKVFADFGQLCVGIDPHETLLEEWGLENSADGVDYFANKVIDAAAGRVGIIKPQVSFFERFGSAGFEVLERVTHRAHDAGLIVIADAKRGDIGSTMEAYLEAWLGRRSPFYADTLTVSPFLGLESTTSLLADYLERGRGVIALVATSNPEGASVQLSETAGESISSQIWNKIGQLNSVVAGPGDKFGAIGAVIGATLKMSRFGLDLAQPGVKTPILAPGFGAQGAELGDIRAIFGEASQQVIASVSRSVLSAGAEGVACAIERSVDELAAALD